MRYLSTHPGLFKIFHAPRGSALLLLTLLPLFPSFSLSRESSDLHPISWKEALQQESGWYESTEAIRIAENVLIHQYENGGWAKNVNLTEKLSETDIIRIREQRTEAARKDPHTTIDNGATRTELRYLAQIGAATGDKRFTNAFLRGLDYLLEAQYDNGGWPQYYPLRKGYHERITFNDGAMIGVMQLLRDVEDGKAPFTFVDETRRERVSIALEKGVDVILKTQIKVDGTLTAWCGQHDETDFSPAAGRSYEHPSISGSESLGIVRYLMTIENPEPEVIHAVQSAVAWFDKAQLKNTRMIDTETDGERDRVIEKNPDNGSSWARFYEIGTNRPIFSGRDGVIKYELAEIERERRAGYRWIGDWGRKLLENDYPAWQKRLDERQR